MTAEKPSAGAVEAARKLPCDLRNVGAIAAHIDRQGIAPAVAEAVKPLVEALESVASEQCCETPGCSEENPHCSTMLARAALAPYRSE